MIFTNDNIDALTATGSRYSLRCDLTTGLTARVSPTGHTSLWHERVINRKKVCTKLGVFPVIGVEASRLRAEELNAIVHAPTPPPKAKPPERSVGAYTASFKEQHFGEIKPSTQKQYSTMLARIEKDYSKIDSITHLSVRRNADKMKTTPVMANRYLATLSVFCRYLTERGAIPFNPAAGARKYKEQPKTSHLKEAELRLLGVELKNTQCNPSIVTAIQILLCTGVRINECCGIERGELDPTADEWLLPAARTKGGRDFLTFLPKPVMDKLTAKPKGHNLLSGERGQLGDSAVRQALGRMCRRAGITAVTPHDLRRTVGTLLAKQGVDPDTRQRFLNHAAVGVTDTRYNVYDYSPKKRETAVLLEGLMYEYGVL